MKTRSAICFLALVAVSSAVKPRLHDIRCGIRVLGFGSKCSSMKYYFDRRTSSCESTCFQGAPFKSTSECNELCRSREVCFTNRPVINCGSDTFDVFYYSAQKAKCLPDFGCKYTGNSFPTLAECRRTCRERAQPLDQAKTSGSDVYRNNTKPSQQQASKPPTATGFPVHATKPGWNNGVGSVTSSQAQPPFTNTGMSPVNNRPSAQKPWTPSHQNNEMASPPAHNSCYLSGMVEWLQRFPSALSHHNPAPR
ncbi:uncharacterized protein LOC125940076 [Dermacentor silvarum]|uniref:uncharacterized protein LOC125940076 n=1 Tax=Dermacentor silvarum TaxID=543639 RepID=UPI0021007560|nr:uncharacterized protein LOC125940076 [Dermacentor silvarum]